MRGLLANAMKSKASQQTRLQNNTSNTSNKSDMRKNSAPAAAARRSPIDKRAMKRDMLAMKAEERRNVWLDETK